MTSRWSRKILTDFSPAAIVEAIEQSTVAATSAYVRLGNGEVHEDRELTWVSTGTPLIYFNGVVRTASGTSTSTDPKADNAVAACIRRDPELNRACQ